jgi:Type I phosphodiesterase / nucleotide pyrophosphatase
MRFMTMPRFLWMRALPALLVTIVAALAPGAEVGYVVLVSIDGFAAYHLDNPKLSLPNIRALAAEGAQAASSETVFPSVTHPAHTTLITGVAPRVHGVLSNRLRHRTTGESFHPTNKLRSESILVPTLFDAAKRKGLATAAFFWPETKGDSAIDYNLPETLDSSNNADPTGAEPRFLAALRQAGVPIDLYYEWYRSPGFKGAADAVLARAAAHTIRAHRPNLLAIHLLATDETQHSYGPDHCLAAAALTNADACVGVLRQAVRDAGIEARTTFFIVADHGFHTVARQVNLYPLFEEAGLTDRVRLHGGDWTLWIELDQKFDRTRDLPALEKVFARALQLEGVARVVRPEDLHGLGLPRYEESPYVQGHYAILADIDTHLAADRSAKSTRPMPKERPYHGHGYLPSHPRMYPALVLSGDRVRRGARLPHTTNYSVAPTIAHLLDLSMPGLPGKMLSEALVP